MSDTEIIRMAVQCGLVTTGNRDSFYVDALGEFAKMVAAAERDACAKICDNLHWEWHMGDTSGPKECATAIRARVES